MRLTSRKTVLSKTNNWSEAQKQDEMQPTVSRSMKVTTTMLVLLILSSCAKAPAPVETHAPIPAVATLSQQKMCSDQADKSFNNSGYAEKSNGSLGNTYTNHFDAAANVCYIEVTTRSMSGKEFLYGHLIYDAFEGRVYGSFTSIGNKPPVECLLKPRDQNEIRCNSQDEFDTFASKHFGTTAD